MAIILLIHQVMIPWLLFIIDIFCCMNNLHDFYLHNIPLYHAFHQLVLTLGCRRLSTLILPCPPTTDRTPRYGLLQWNTHIRPLAICINNIWAIRIQTHVNSNWLSHLRCDFLLFHIQYCPMNADYVLIRAQKTKKNKKGFVGYNSGESHLSWNQLLVNYMGFAAGIWKKYWSEIYALYIFMGDLKSNWCKFHYCQQSSDNPCSGNII